MLVREWHGTKHQVSVLPDGFLYRAKRYGSLSQIARTITGTQRTRDELSFDEVERIKF